MVLFFALTLPELRFHKKKDRVNIYNEITNTTFYISKIIFCLFQIGIPVQSGTVI